MRQIQKQSGKKYDRLNMANEMNRYLGKEKHVPIARLLAVCLMLLSFFANDIKAQSAGSSGIPVPQPVVVPLVLTYQGWLPSSQTIPAGPVVFLIRNETLLDSMALNIQSLAGVLGAVASTIHAETPASALGTTLHSATFTASGDYTMTISNQIPFSVKLTVKAQ